MENFGLRQEDTPDRDRWPLRIKGKLANVGKQRVHVLANRSMNKGRQVVGSDNTFEHVTMMPSLKRRCRTASQ